MSNPRDATASVASAAAIKREQALERRLTRQIRRLGKRLDKTDVFISRLERFYGKKGLRTIATMAIPRHRT